MNDSILARPPQQKRSRASTERMLEAAAEVISESGWAGFTMQAVSQRAGVSIPLLHHRFRNKESLFLAAQSHVLDAVEEELTATFSGPRWDGLSAAAAIEKAVRNQADVFALHGRLLRGFRERGLVDIRVRDRAIESISGARAGFSSQMLRHQGEFTHDNPALAIDVGFGLISAALDHEVQFNESALRSPAWEATVKELVVATQAYFLGPPAMGGALAEPAPAQPVDQSSASDDPRELLLRCGTTLLAQGGYAAVTAAAVCRCARVAIATLYQSFASKQLLVEAVEQHAVQQLLEAAAAAFNQPDIEADARLAAAVQMTSQLVVANQAAIRVLVQRRRDDDPAYAMTRTALDDLAGLFHECALPGEHDRTARDATTTCFRVVYSALTEYVPHEEYLSTPVTRDRFLAEETRFCRQYLNARLATPTEQ